MRVERRATSIAAGIVSTPASPSSNATQALRLLLDVGPANGRWWYRPADHAGDGDQGQDIGQRLEQHRRAPPWLREAERESRRAAEEQGGGKRAERTPVSEDDRGKRDEAPAGSHILAERAEIADREIGAAERSEHSR